MERCGVTPAAIRESRMPSLNSGLVGTGMVRPCSCCHEKVSRVSTIGSRFGTPGKPRPIRLRSRTLQLVGVSESWNCSAMAGSCDPPASQITLAAASRPSNASSKPSAWPAASSSSVRAKLGLTSWWERECDVGFAKIPSSFVRTDG